METTTTKIDVIAPVLRDCLQRAINKLNDGELEQATFLRGRLTDQGLGGRFRLGSLLYFGGDTDPATLGDQKVRGLRVPGEEGSWQVLMTEHRGTVIAASRAEAVDWFAWAASVGLTLKKRPRHFYVNGPGSGFLVDQETADRIAELAEQGKALDVDVLNPVAELYDAYCDQLSLEGSDEPQATWREWLGFHDVNPDDPKDVERFFREYPDPEWPWFSDEEGMQCTYMDVESETFVMPDLNALVHYEMITDMDGEIMPEVYKKLPSVRVVEVVDVDGLAEPIGDLGKPLGEISIGEMGGPGGSATGVWLSGKAAASGLQLRLLELGHRIKIHF